VTGKFETDPITSTKEVKKEARSLLENSQGCEKALTDFAFVVAYHDAIQFYSVACKALQIKLYITYNSTQQL